MGGWERRKEGCLFPGFFSWVCLVLTGFQLKLLHDGVVTHLEPDILECKVKSALGSITMNKVSGGDGIPADLFRILKDDAVKVLHSIGQQIWKTQQWPQDWIRSVFISIQKAMPKNVQITIQLHSSHMPARLCSKSFKLGFSST